MSFILPELHAPLAQPWSPEWDLELTRRLNDEAFADQHVSVPGTALNVVAVGDMEVRAWHPTGREPERVIYAVHGGGYTAGRAYYDDLRNAEMAAAFSALVISPDYRLAPEFPFPIPAEDCLAGLDWAVDHAGELPIYLYGDSAGAGLVETVAAWHLDRGGRGLEGLICLEPAIDPLLQAASLDTYAQGPAWSKEKAAASWDCYLDGQDSSVLPRLADRAEKLPPVLVFINPVDPLRDEGAAWAFGLADAGARVEMHMMPGSYHSALSISGTRTWERVQGIICTFMEVFAENGVEVRPTIHPDL